MFKQFYDNHVLQAENQSDLYVLIEQHSPVTLSMLRSLCQNINLFGASDPTSTERRFLATLEKLKNDGLVVISGAIPCNQATISLA